MLETMRNASKGWFAGIMILLLIGSFGVWGVQDMINMTSAPKIATLGGEDITPEQFSREFNRFLKQMERESQTKLSTTEAKALGLDREALDRMLTRKALLKKAEAIGLSVSNQQIKDSLSSAPGLSDGKGGIDPSALQRILQTNEMSEAEFLSLVRADMLREQLIGTILAGVQMPQGLEMALNRFRLERRIAEYVQIDPTRAGEIKDPDDATLRKYYTEHAQARYSTPELRAVTLVTARAADVASLVQVTDDEIKKAYETNKRFYQTPEKRTLEQIRFKTESKAREAKAKLDSGKSFESVALAEGFKPDDVRLGEVSKTDTTIPAIAFELDVGAISAPTKGPFGWVILRALSVTPGTEKALDEVKQEIKDRFIAERSKDKLFELTNAFEDSRGAGDTLEEAAKKHKLTPVKIAAVDQSGNDANGVTVEGLPGGDFLQRLFLAEGGLDSELNETPDGVYYEFRVDKVSPAANKPFDQIREKVLADWRADELTTRLKKIADDLVKRGNGGESMTKIADSLGVAALRTEPMPRLGKTALFATETVAAAADAKMGGFFSGPVAEGKSIIVGRLAEIMYAPEAADANLRATYSEQLRRSFASDMAQQFSTTVRGDLDVTIDEKRFNTFHTGE
ncbi:MAG: SurA N-terminal domain-containing protein [Alphaproteobacteria bacterium]|nr:SurA N-terminal domain-containing protein [Alphaproteobacteria bacterium]